METLVMALQFKNLKSPLLGLDDKIPVGKLLGCRVCDVIQDHYEYLIWANKAGILKYTKVTCETILKHAGFEAQEQHYAEEIEPWTKDYDLKMLEKETGLVDEDIPF